MTIESRIVLILLFKERRQAGRQALRGAGHSVGVMPCRGLFIVIHYKPREFDHLVLIRNQGGISNIGKIYPVLAVKSSSSRICNLWWVSECSRPSSHTCPEALIKLSELVIKYLLKFGHILRLIIWPNYSCYLLTDP